MWRRMSPQRAAWREPLPAGWIERLDGRRHPDDLNGWSVAVEAELHERGHGQVGWELAADAYTGICYLCGGQVVVRAEPGGFVTVAYPRRELLQAWPFQGIRQCRGRRPGRPAGVVMPGVRLLDAVAVAGLVACGTGAGHPAAAASLAGSAPSRPASPVTGYVALGVLGVVLAGIARFARWRRRRARQRGRS